MIVGTATAKVRSIAVSCNRFVIAFGEGCYWDSIAGWMHQF